jgi:CheY-like chemotaxis protein
MQLNKDIMNCSTRRAENGQVALDILRNSMPGQFDLILMDLRMPVMDGLEATKLIREELKMTDIPILALTGETRDDIQSECEGIGFTEFFSKPLPKAKLEETIHKYKALRDGVETR